MSMITHEHFFFIDVFDLPIYTLLIYRCLWFTNTHCIDKCLWLPINTLFIYRYLWFTHTHSIKLQMSMICPNWFNLSVMSIISRLQDPKTNFKLQCRLPNESADQRLQPSEAQLATLPHYTNPQGPILQNFLAVSACAICYRTLF